jgi:hypothetical protein
MGMDSSQNDPEAEYHRLSGFALELEGLKSFAPASDTTTTSKKGSVFILVNILSLDQAKNVNGCF